MASPIVGLDIGTHQIKAVELANSAKEGLAVTNVAVMPTPPGLLQNNVLTDPMLMGRVIKQMLKESGIRAKRAVGSVAGQNAVVVRIIEVPKMSPSELAETMKWEVERHVSFAPNEVQMDYQVLPVQENSESNPNMSVLLAAGQQDVITTYVDMMFAAGLDPIAIDIEPLAAGRGLLDIINSKPVVRTGLSSDNPYDLSTLNAHRETVAIVNIGAANTDVSIYEDGQLIFPRSLPIAGDSLTRAVSEMLGFTIEQAERIKIEHGSVIIERMGDYTGSFYGQPDEQPEPFVYQEEPTTDFGALADQQDLGSFRSPFDLSDDEQAQATPDFDEITAPPGADPLDRTQPIPRRTLDLARQSAASDFTGSADFDLSGTTDAGETRNQVFEAIAPVLAELSTELRRSLEYHRSRTRGRGVDRIILCGGTAGLLNLDQFLSSELSVPVELASPFANLTISTKQYDPAYLVTISPVFTVALGLASREAVLAVNPPDPTLKVAKAPVTAGSAVGSASTFLSGIKLPFGPKKLDSYTAPPPE